MQTEGARFEEWLVIARHRIDFQPYICEIQLWNMSSHCHRAEHKLDTFNQISATVAETEQFCAKQCYAMLCYIRPSYVTKCREGKRSFPVCCSVKSGIVDS